MSMATPWFNVRKAAQACAFFALKAHGQINVLKLIKLVYLADRRFMQKYDCTMLNDKLVSMPHGPVNSLTLNYVNGMLVDEEWDRFIADRERHMLAVSDPSITVDDLDELSAAELECLEETWGAFGHLDPFALRDYTHQHCPEWEDPHGSSTPIPYVRLFKFLGKTEMAEHPFITVNSYVEYRMARITDAAHIAKCVDGWVYTAKEPASPALLQRICDGVERSRFVAKRIAVYYATNKS